MGPHKAQQVEDAMLSWLSENRDKDVLAAAGESAPIEVASAPVTENADLHKFILWLKNDNPNLSAKGTGEQWDEGFKSRERGEPLEAVSYTWTTTEGADWLAGWLTHEQQSLEVQE